MSRIDSLRTNLQESCEYLRAALSWSWSPSWLSWNPRWSKSSSFQHGEFHGDPTINYHIDKKLRHMPGMSVQAKHEFTKDAKMNRNFAAAFDSAGLADYLTDKGRAAYDKYNASDPIKSRADIVECLAYELDEHEESEMLDSLVSVVVSQAKLTRVENGIAEKSKAYRKRKGDEYKDWNAERMQKRRRIPSEPEQFQ